MKCKKCGLENPDSAKFCSNCGTKLEKENIECYKCPKCGVTFEGKQKFCNNCGLEFIYPDCDLTKVPHLVQKKESVSKSTMDNDSLKNEFKTNKVLEIIYRWSIVFFVLFSTIGIFGAFAKMVGTYGGATAVSETYGLSYWFDTGWQILGKNANSDIAFVISFASFVIGLIGTIIFVILQIINSIRSFKNEDIVPDKFIKPIIAFEGQYFLIALSSVSATADMSSTIKTSANLGWGSILFIIGLFVLALVAICRGIINSTTNKKNLSCSILGSCVAIVALISIFMIKTNANMDIKLQGVVESLSPLACLIEMSVFGPAGIPLGSFVLYNYIATIGSILLILSLMLYIGSIIKNKHGITLPILMLVGIIVATTFSCLSLDSVATANGMTHNSVSISVSTSAIVFAVFSFLILGGEIALKVLKKQKAD